MAAEAEPRLVVALDYGTTYTGVAYAVVTGHDPLDLDDVKVLTSWPRTEAQKVPSVISWSPSLKGCRQWGYDIDENSMVIKWTKLQLERKDRVSELNTLNRTLKSIQYLGFNDSHAVRNDIPHFLAKDEMEIIREYLENVAEILLEEIVSVEGRNIPQRVPIDMIVTHPAMWNDNAKNRTYKTVLDAFKPTVFPTLRNLYLVPEPEACALFTLRSAQRKGTDKLRIDDCFVVCDGGGGTIDLISYRVISLEPTLEIEQIGYISGGSCGSTAIDRYFLYKWLPEKLDKKDYESLIGDLNQLGSGGHWVVGEGESHMLSLFEELKHTFTGKDTGLVHYIPLPRGIGQINDPARGIEDGKLQITTDDLKEMFHEAVAKTITLISEQVTQVEIMKLHVRCIFLSGGFAQSDYLLDRVNAFALSRRISLERGDECWTAVVKGAVLRGLGIGMTAPSPVKKCPRHFGVVISESYASFKHTQEDMYYDTLDGSKKAKGQLKWLVTKGDLILPEKPTELTFKFARKFRGEDPKSFRLIFVASTESNPPSRLDEASHPTTQNFNIDYDLGHIPESQLIRARDGKYFMAILTLGIRVFDDVRLTLHCGQTELPTHPPIALE